MPNGRKIKARLAARQAGHTGEAPNPHLSKVEGAVTKPGSKNARKYG